MRVRARFTVSPFDCFWDVVRMNIYMSFWISKTSFRLDDLLHECVLCFFISAVFNDFYMVHRVTNTSTVFEQAGVLFVLMTFLYVFVINSRTTRPVDSTIASFWHLVQLTEGRSAGIDPSPPAKKGFFAQGTMTATIMMMLAAMDQKKMKLHQPVSKLLAGTLAVGTRCHLSHKFRPVFHNKLVEHLCFCICLLVFVSLGLCLNLRVCVLCPYFFLCLCWCVLVLFLYLCCLCFVFVIFCLCCFFRICLSFCECLCLCFCLFVFCGFVLALFVFVFPFFATLFLFVMIARRLVSLLQPSCQN